MSSLKLIERRYPVRKFKVHVARGPDAAFQKEWLWAEPAPSGPNHARLLNIPCTLWLGEGDVVEFDPEDENRITKVIMKGSRTVGASYEAIGDKVTDRANRMAIREHLARFAIGVEFMTKRLFMMSVPLNMTDKRHAEIVAACPVMFEAFST